MITQVKNFILVKINETNNLLRQIEEVTSLNGLNCKTDAAYITLVGMKSAYETMLQQIERYDDNRKLKLGSVYKRTTDS